MVVGYGRDDQGTSLSPSPPPPSGFQRHTETLLPGSHLPWLLLLSTGKLAAGPAATVKAREVVPGTFKGYQFLLPSVIPEELLPASLMTSLSPSQESAIAHHHARWGLLEGLLQDAGWARVLGREHWDGERWPS